MFTTAKQLNKLLACFLAALLLMSNTVALAPVYAATSANTSEQTSELPAITLDKQVADQSPIKQNADTDSFLTTKQKVVQFINQLIPYYAQNGKQQGPEWLRTTDINLTITEDFKPIYSLETLQPFTKEVTDGKLGFWQGRYAYQSGATSTANFGIGVRWLSEDKTSIKGINAFYDYAFQHDLSRVGVGAELFNKQAEYRANVYIPTSGDRQTGVTTIADGILYSYIRAVSGFDYEVGTSLANAPWLSLYASGFHYDNKHKEDENGYRLRSKMQVTPRLSMEMGYTNSNLASGSLYGKVLYQLADTAGPALRGGSANELSGDISHKLLQKVQRENEIKTETFTKLVAYTGSLSVTVTSSGAALQGAQVQAYQNGSPVGAAATTDANGIAVISGLAAGAYTVRATYFSVSDDSSTVIVQKDQTTSVPPIALAIVGGKAFIHVLDSAGADVGGATVTAEATSGLHGAADKSFFDRILGVKTAYAAAGFKVTAVTNASGIATFPNLPAGNYKFTVTYSGQEMKSLSVKVEDGSTSNSTVVLPASGGNIVAMISDAVSKAGITGAAVELKSGSTVIDTKTTDSDGIAVFSGLTAGSTYTVTAKVANYSDQSISTTVTDKETVAAAIALTPLAPQTVNVTIAVIDYEDKQPVGEAKVTVTLDGVTISTTNTTSDGIATIKNLLGGYYYTFTVTKEGYSKSSLSTTIVDTTTETLNLIRPKGQITITVNGTDGKPISGVDVSTMVEIVGEIQPVIVPTNDSGIAVFTKLPTKTYTFTATKAGFVSNTTEVTVLGDQQKAGTITLSPKLITAQVNVKDGDGKDMAWMASVRVTGNGVDQTNKTDASGNVTFSLPAGEYIFTATYINDGIYTNDSKTILLSDETSSVKLTIIRKVGSITMIVKDKNSQQPISGAEISVSYSDPKIVLGYTDGEGKFILANVSTGQTYYTANKVGYTGMISGVTVKEGTNEHVIELSRLPGKAKVTVKSGTKLLEGATVVPEGGSSKTTNTSGIVYFGSVTSGQVTFTASMPGYVSKTITATIAPGDGYNDPYTPVEINLTALDPATLVTLTVNSNYDPALNNVVLYLRDEDGFEIAASSKTGSQMIFSGLAPNSTYTIIGKFNGAYRSEFDQGVNMGSIDRTVAYNKFQ